MLLNIRFEAEVRWQPCIWTLRKRRWLHQLQIAAQITTHGETPYTLKTIAQCSKSSDGMQGAVNMLIFPFPCDVASRGYDAFPTELEEDRTVFFHATPTENLRSICREGLRPDPQKTSGLHSVTYTYRSNTALIHATTRNKNASQEYCILAVRFDQDSISRLFFNNTDAHDYKIKPSPNLIGYCVIPQNYNHL